MRGAGQVWFGDKRGVRIRGSLHEGGVRSRERAGLHKKKKKHGRPGQPGPAAGGRLGVGPGSFVPRTPARARRSTQLTSRHPPFLQSTARPFPSPSFLPNTSLRTVASTTTQSQHYPPSLLSHPPSTRSLFPPPSAPEPLHLRVRPSLPGSTDPPPTLQPCPARRRPLLLPCWH